jgi:hypothetical protein
MANPRIRTRNTGPYFPWWLAWDEDRELPCGTGRTEAEAIQNFMESL